MIELGHKNRLTVLRKSDLGYMLSDGTDEVLLHFKQSTRELNIGEVVDVFCYSDKEKRKTATMIEPKVTLEDANFAEVVDILKGIGVFVNVGTPKDVLVSKDYLPYDEEQWPKAGDYLCIRLKKKNDSLVGKPFTRFEIKELYPKDIKYALYEHVNGYVARINEKGVGIVTLHKIYVFVPLNQLRGILRLGMRVEVTITKELDSEYYGTLNAHKEELIDTDRDEILKYLNEHHGLMKLTAKSSSEDIAKIFPNMSRKAFKRAYGGLYKDHLIEFDDSKTKKI